VGFNVKDALADIDRVLSHQVQGGGSQASAEAVALMSACIERWTPPTSSYRVRPVSGASSLPHISKQDQHVRGALQALRADYAAGLTPRTFEEIIHASVSDDLLIQGSALLEEGYILAGAVVVGAVLEEHLRQLASHHSVAVVKPNGDAVKASGLNADLHKAGAYSQAERTQVEAWQKLRNDAAHNAPEFQGVSARQVAGMLNGVRDFVVRHPA
jgi:hypothetical protein